MITRRTSLAVVLSGLLTNPARASLAQLARDKVGSIPAVWQAGCVDIHHISTGRGDATLIIGPNGDASLIDVGAVERPDPAKVAPMPDGSKRAGEWIAVYITNCLRETGQDSLRSVLLTHLHPDHIGGVSDETPLDPTGRYRLTGVSDLAAKLTIGKIIDPDYPNYGFPPFEDRVSAENYVNFISAYKSDGGQIEALKVGRTGQILPNALFQSARFSIRGVAARGRIWTGTGDNTRMVFLDRNSLAREDYPGENASSSALLLQYGAFRYFLGGDITDWADAGARPWLNALSPLARAIGRVDVAVLPHHGMFDSASSSTIAALQARAWIISAWHAAHPSPETLERVFSQRLYDGPREVFATAIHPAVGITQGRMLQRLSGRDGHVIVRIAPGGGNYNVVIVNPKDGLVQHVSPSIASNTQT